jgi:hypothetical protein
MAHHLRVQVVSHRTGVYAVTSDGDDATTALLNEMVDRYYSGDYIAAVKNGASCHVDRLLGEGE